MREIKFRAWDKKHNRMKSVEELDFAYYATIPKAPQGMITDIWLNGESKSYFPSEIELLEYTGLKDKNDEEIYESDILTWPNAAIPDKEIVFFEDGAFCVHSLDGCKHFLGKDKLNICCEKIGNIYENPDLLEK